MMLCKSISDLLPPSQPWRSYRGETNVSPTSTHGVLCCINRKLQQQQKGDWNKELLFVSYPDDTPAVIICVMAFHFTIELTLLYALYCWPLAFDDSAFAAEEKEKQLYLWIYKKKKKGNNRQFNAGFFLFF